MWQAEQMHVALRFQSEPFERDAASSSTDCCAGQNVDGIRSVMQEELPWRSMASKAMLFV